MAEVRLRTTALSDLETIFNYSIAQFGLEQAEIYLKSFEFAFDLLRRHPFAGALRTQIDPPIRSLPHRSHRIFYDVEGDVIWIVRVLHHAMDVERLLGERP